MLLVQKFWLTHYDLCPQDVWFTSILKCSPFWFLHSLEYLPVQFSSRLFIGNTFIHVFCYILVLGSQGWFFFFFWVFKSSVLVFAEKLSLCFCLANFECDEYLAVHHGLVYSHSITFLLLFSLSFSLIPGLKSSFFINILVLFTFCFLLLDLASCRIGILPLLFSSL